MRTLIFVVALLTSAVAHCRTNSVYICEIKDVASASEEGRLRSSSYHDLIKKTFKEIVFDENTSMVRHQGNSWQMQIVQYGSANNSLKAQRTLAGPVSYVINYIRIDVWRSNMTFTYFNDGEVYTGTCRKI